MEEKVTMNKMGIVPIPKILLTMGIPMIFSMVLQACYNIVDSIFVAALLFLASVHRKKKHQK